MQLSQKQLHQKNKQQNNKHRETSSQSGLCISEESLRDLLCLGFDTESNLIWQATSFSTSVYVCVCVLKLFFCWEHNCAFWFWRLLTKEPRSIVISNGQMESDTQSWLVHSEHPCIIFPSGQQCVWCGHHPMFFAECLRHQCWRWRVVQDRVWPGHGQVNHFNNDVEHRLCVGMWVWTCEMCCNRLQCKHSRPECFETHPGRTVSLALESIRARSSAHPPFFAAGWFPDSVLPMWICFFTPRFATD